MADQGYLLAKPTGVATALVARSLPYHSPLAPQVSLDAIGHVVNIQLINGIHICRSLSDSMYCSIG